MDIFYGYIYTEMEGEVCDDMLNKMLLAITDEASPTQLAVSQQSVPLEDQKKYIKRNINMLPIADRREVGNTIIRNNMASTLAWCSEGTVVNMDKLPDHVISQMYELIYYNLAKVQ